jgi:hypothetical protein
MTTVLKLILLALLASMTEMPVNTRRDLAMTEPISVIVRSSSTPRRAIQGNRVVVLGADGSELAESSTNSGGAAFLQYKPGVVHPLFVLVEAYGCYVSGLRWVSDASEYYILVTGRAAM